MIGSVRGTVFERAQVRTDLVKRILEKVAESKKVQIATPAVAAPATPAVPVLR